MKGLDVATGGRVGIVLRAALERIRRSTKRKAKPASQRSSLPRGVIDEFCASLRNKDCIVFGSAPNPVLVDRRDRPIVCCNGAAASLKQSFNCAPDYTFMHCHVLASWKQSDKEVRDALGGIDRFGRTVMFDIPGESYSTELIETRAAEIASFDWSRRHDLVSELLGTSVPFLKFSTGAFSAACVLRAGAKSVELVGFSLDQKGHGYNVKDRYRNHVRSDAALFALLAQAGYNLSSREPSIAMILTERID